MLYLPYPKRLWALVYTNIKHRNNKIDLISYNRSHLFIAVCLSYQIPLQTEYETLFLCPLLSPKEWLKIP